MTSGGVGGGDLESLQRRLQGKLDSIGALAAEVEDRGKQSAASDAMHDEARAKRARAGELGPDWRRLQQRIDLRETTLRDALSGVDESPDARAVLQNSRSSLRKLSDEITEEQSDPSKTSEIGEALQDIRSLNSSIASRIDALKRLNLG